MGLDAASLPHASDTPISVRVSPWPSACVLVAANLLPVYGVLELEWPVMSLLALFWMEVAVVGMVTVLSMLYAPASGVLARIARLGAVLLFCFGYGLLGMTYGLFLAVAFKYDAYLNLFHGLLGISSVAPPDAAPEFTAIVSNAFLGGGLLLLQEVGSAWFALAAIGALAASHLLAFFRHYVGRGKFRAASLPVLGFKPFGRLALLQVVVVVGGAAATAGDAPVWAAVVLIGAKTVADLIGHLREWSRLRPPR